MNILRHFLVIVLFSSSLLAQQGSNTSTQVLETDIEVFEELSSKEWKKFKSFKKKLEQMNIATLDKEKQLKAYAKDSLQILNVKLIAIKLLREKKLLQRDIIENPKYYKALLNEFRHSDIPHAEYLFLEEKMAFLNQEQVQQKLNQSRWLNIGLILCCIGLGYMLFSIRKSKQKTTRTELSKQEVTVKNLILQGKTNKEIASELFISLSTVKTHITNLYSKLNVTNRKELLQKGYRY